MTIYPPEIGRGDLPQICGHQIGSDNLPPPEIGRDDLPQICSHQIGSDDLPLHPTPPQNVLADLMC